MKYSDDTEEHRKANIDYVNRRWKELNSLELDFSSDGIKYLLLVNAGAAVAVLAFHGSVATVRDMVWPKVMLGFFVMGVILIGVLHIARYIGVKSLFGSWRESANGYFTDVKDWHDVINEDVAKAKKFYWVAYLAYASFSCFVIGATIGMFNFSTLTSGESHVGKETAAIAATKANTTTSPTVNQQDRGRGPEEISDAKHASAATNSQEKVTVPSALPLSGVYRK